MNKRFILLVISLGIIALLTGCGSKADLTDYIEVDFNGYDTMGTASYTLDEDKLINDVFEISEDYSQLDMEMLTEIDNMMSSFTITLDKDSDLSNGDKVIVNIKVDKDKADKIKSKDEVEFEVSGLKEPNKLSDEEIEKNVVVNYLGVSGKGETQIDTTFEGDLSNLSFESKQDGSIKNGDKVVIVLTKDSKSSLAALGYVLDGKGKAEFKASGLDVVANKPSEIANLEDVNRFISEGINREYEDSTYGFYKYEIIKESSYYRQFMRDEDSSSWGSSSPSNGTLVNLYTIKESDSNGELNSTFTAVYGYTDIILDDKNSVNLTEMNEYLDRYDDTYSLASVEKLMEGYGYEKVE